jgi:hypothetical protein
MLRKKLTCVSFLVLGVMIAGPARAALIEIVSDADTAPLVTPANNDVLGGGLAGSIGATLELSQRAEVTFEFLGFEAGFTNLFQVGGATVFDNQTAAVGATFSQIFDPGAIDFQFDVTNTGEVVTNVGNDGGAPENFFVYRVNDGEVIVALDDSGAGPDDNHDDHVVRMTAVATPVPEPASLASFALGLLVVSGSVLHRRRTS